MNPNLLEMDEMEQLAYFAGLSRNLAADVEQLKAKLLECKRHHYYCEDCWYSCPKAEDGTCNSFKDGKCDCGADEFNRELEEFVAKF